MTPQDRKSMIKHSCQVGECFVLQEVKVDFSYQIGHWAYEVFDSFPDAITFAD